MSTPYFFPQFAGEDRRGAIYPRLQYYYLPTVTTVSWRVATVNIPPAPGMHPTFKTRRHPRRRRRTARRQPRVVVNTQTRWYARAENRQRPRSHGRSATPPKSPPVSSSHRQGAQGPRVQHWRSKAPVPSSDGYGGWGSRSVGRAGLHPASRHAMEEEDVWQ